MVSGVCECECVRENEWFAPVCVCGLNRSYAGKSPLPLKLHSYILYSVPMLCICWICITGFWCAFFLFSLFLFLRRFYSSCCSLANSHEFWYYFFFTCAFVYSFGSAPCQPAYPSRALARAMLFPCFCFFIAFFEWAKLHVVFLHLKSPCLERIGEALLVLVSHQEFDFLI